jgi:glyoxylase-like metal-dependent hydrolase (beta-lactamase superfamily II)
MKQNVSSAASIIEPLEFPHPAAPQPGQAIELAPGLLWLRIPLPFALDHVNIWLARERDGWTLIDTGFANDATRALWSDELAAVLDGQPIIRIVATHAHPDHIGLADWLAQRYPCPLWITQGEYLWAHAVWNDIGGHGVEQTVALFARHGLDSAEASAQLARGRFYRQGVPAVPTTYHRIYDGEHIEIGGRRWRVIVGYGHSAEHAALYCESLPALISGDMLLPTISTNVSVWPTDPDADPVGRFLQSIERFADLPARTLVLPSHGLPFRGARQRVAALHDHHAARLAELAAAATHPVTAAEVVPVLFRRKLDVYQTFFAMGEAIAHLNHLYCRGQLTRTVRKDGVIQFARST